MQFIPRDPDLETLTGRIRRGSIDLQPDFQRGDVWSAVKQQRLIDSVLRGWHIPPVHLVARPDGAFDVLDGQQRLTALRDFVLGKFAVDGRIEPFSPQLVNLHKLRYEELPLLNRRQFDGFSIRVLELHNYQPGEPHELFFRLNQPTSLTEAEKRNAFIGGARNQVKQLVQWAVDNGMTADRIGFSNSRLAYDDIVARFLLTIEQGNLTEKVTAQRVTARYRDDSIFSEAVIDTARTSLGVLLGQQYLGVPQALVRMNKATLHTWLCVLATLAQHASRDLLDVMAADVIPEIEQRRTTRAYSSRSLDDIAISIFSDRATARVADTSSVVLRDLIAWMFLVRRLNAQGSHRAFEGAAEAWRVASVTDDAERQLLTLAQNFEWGQGQWI